MFSTTALLIPLALSACVSASAIAPRARTTLQARAHVVGHNISAQFNFTGFIDGRATVVQFTVDSGLTLDPALGGGGPFIYHIHTNPIPADGNCTKALAHLDPYNVTESIKCDPDLPQWCQEGDLSGKHGKLDGSDGGTIDFTEYSDAYIRFFPVEASILGRSIVIHSANKTRLACGNITSPLDGTSSEAGIATNHISNFVTTYPSAAPVQPAQIIQPFNGTAYPPQSYIDALPYPLPLHAVPLNESVNIKFRPANRHIKVNNVNVTVTQPKGEIAPGPGPF